MGKRAKADVPLDLELGDLPTELRWREWMGRVEAVIFASSEPVLREVLARVIGKSCNLDLLIGDIKEELRGRPYELATVAGGWRLQTRKHFAEAIQASTGLADGVKPLSQAEAGALMAVAYFQPVTRGELSEMFGREISRDLIGSLRAAGLIAAGPRSPQPGAPYAYVTTSAFLSQFGFGSLQDLPDLERLEDAGMLDHATPRVRGVSIESSVVEVSTILSDLASALGPITGDEDLDQDAA